jgi:hypothetical protein
MNDNVLIALIIAVALVCIIVVFALRGRFRSGTLKVSKDGIEGGVEANGPLATKIVGVKITGDRNKMAAENGGQIEQAELEGHDNDVKSCNS